MRFISHRYSSLIKVSRYQITMIFANLTFRTPNEIPTNDSAVDFVSEAVLLARSIMELVRAEVGVGEVFRELVTEMEVDLEDGEYWDRIEDGREDVAAMELDLRL